MKNIYVSLVLIIFGSIYSFSQTPELENQPIPDLGNSTYQNPILPGRYPDPSIVKVESDYYLVNSQSGTPSLMIWHSKDLVNWQPLDYAVKEYYGNSWAPDITYYNGKFYIYTTFVQHEDDISKRTFDNFVLIADKPEGPWSKPINIHVKGKIDPGHLSTPEGKRYLYFNTGIVYELDESGTKVIGDPIKVYDGWEYPEEWVVECFCLEGPKMFFKDGYYYMVTAQGGTAGPATSHMTVVARSKSPLGPFINCPYNPLIKTRHKSERWWSQGHTTLVEAPNGNWFSIHHAFIKDFRHLGRQNIMVPIDWTEDGWPINRLNDNAEGIYDIPSTDKSIKGGMALSDEFHTDKIGMQWRSFTEKKPKENFTSGGSKLIAKAEGTQVNNGPTLGILPVNTSYEVEVKLTLESGTSGGIVLVPRAFSVNNATSFGVGFKDNRIIIHQGERIRDYDPIEGNSIYLKVRNYENDIILFYSSDGKNWKKLGMSLEVIHVKALTALLYANGKGNVTFEHFKYRGL